MNTAVPAPLLGAPTRSSTERVAESQLGQSESDANGGVAGNQAFAFIGTSAFSAAGQLRYVQIGTDTFIQANTNADTGTIELELKLTGLHALSGVDFIL